MHTRDTPGGGKRHVWRPLADADANAVAAIAAQIHPSLPERTAVLAEKWRLFPPGCRTLVDGEGGTAGYTLAHPWTLTAPPALDQFLHRLPAAADCLFIHDVALLPEARGRGAAAQVIDHAVAVAVAHRLPALALIAAYGTERLWRRFGFVDVGGADLALKIAAYGAEARYLTRSVG